MPASNAMSLCIDQNINFSPIVAGPVLMMKLLALLGVKQIQMDDALR